MQMVWLWLFPGSSFWVQSFCSLRNRRLMLSSSFVRFSSVPAFGITTAAAEQIKKLLKGDFENRILRIGLKDGGCAGFQYDFGFEAKEKKGDHVFEKDGAKVVLDDKALLYLRKANLDYVSNPFNSTFKIVLPHDTEFHSCSCGKSVGKEHHTNKCSE